MGVNWRHREIAPAGEDVLSHAEDDSAIANRLQRLKARSAPAAQDISPGPARSGGAIALARNPFAVLEVEIDASSDAVNQAFDTLSFEPGRDPAQLDAARAALHAPRDRLEAELGWLPGLPGPTLQACREALRAGNGAILASIREKASGIARLNLDLVALDLNPANHEAAAQALFDLNQVDSEALLEQLDDARARSGFRGIDRAMFDGCIRMRAEAIATQLARAFAGSPAARMTLSQALQRDGNTTDPFGTTFRDALLRAYGGEIDSTLEQARARISASVEALRAQPDSATEAAALITTLDYWSNLRRPVQIHEAARGLDDPASAEIFAGIRELAVDLSNQHKAFEIALRLMRALMRSFALVPMHRAALQRELPALLGIVLMKRAEQLREIALGQPAAFARQVEAGGLDTNAGTAGAIGGLFSEADEMESSSGALTGIFWVVRDLAIKLNNKHHRVRAAQIILKWLAARHPPAEVAPNIEEDLRRLGAQMNVETREEQVAGRESATPGKFGRAERSSAQREPRSAAAASQEDPRRSRRTPRFDRSATERGPRRRKLTVGQMILVILIVSAMNWARGPFRQHSPAPRDAAEQIERLAPEASPTSRYSPPSRAEVMSEYERRAEQAARDRKTEPDVKFIPGQPMIDARPPEERAKEPGGTQ